MSFKPRFASLALLCAVATLAPAAVARADGGIQMLPPVPEAGKATPPYTACPDNNGIGTFLTWDGKNPITCATGIVASNGQVSIGTTKLFDTGIGNAPPIPGIQNAKSLYVYGDIVTGTGHIVSNYDGLAGIAGSLALDAGPAVFDVNGQLANPGTGIYFRSTNVVGQPGYSSTIPGYKDIMFVRSDGNVGIGEISPSYYLDVFGTVDGMNGAGNPTARFSSASPGLTYLDIQNTNRSNGTNGGVLRFITENVGQTGTTSFDIVKYADGVAAFNNWESNSAAAIAFGIGPQYVNGQVTGIHEAMRITSNGNLGIGTPNPSAPLDVFNGFPAFETAGTAPTDQTGLNLITKSDGNYLGNSPNGLGWQIYARGNNFTNTPNNFGISFWNGGYWNQMFTMTPNGNVGIGNLTPTYVLDVSGQARFTGNYTTSDSRLKTKITDLGYGLSEVLKLHPVFFDWRKPVKGEEGRRVGFIAQEVQQVIPEIVSTATDEMKTKAVEYGNITPVLVKAIQEQQAQLQAQQKEIEALRQKISQMNGN